MTIDFKKIKKDVDILAVVGSEIALTTRGNYARGLCPFHDDTKPSLSVYPNTGIIQCHACSFKGDVIDFLSTLHGISKAEAVEKLQGVSKPSIPLQKGLKPKQWLTSTPPAECPEPPTFELKGLVGPVAKWAYHDERGRIIGWVARYTEKVHGKESKTFRQWTWGQYGDQPASWQPYHFTPPRPLFNLHKLHEKPNTQVLIVEGEKTAMAAQALFPQFVCTTWPGGANAYRHAKWDVLKGRSVVLIPDNDDPSRQAMQQLAVLLVQQNCSVKIVDVEKDREPTWDLADALEEKWTPEFAYSWAKSRISEFHLDKPFVEPSPVTKVGRLQDVDTMSHISPQPPAFSDVAIAQRLHEIHGMNWRYVADRGFWRFWNGSFWENDVRGQIFGYARDLLIELTHFEDASLLNESSRRSLTSKMKIESVVGTWRFDQRVMTVLEDWDRDPWKLCTPKGIVSLKTGKLSPPKREDMMTQSTLVSPGGECPLWITFLDRITNGDRDLQDYLQRLCGYALTGVTTEQMLAFFYGTGANGKGVFLRTISKIMNTYATASKMDTFAENKTERHLTEWARLVGKRLIHAQETDEGKRWAESKIKEFTGGDKVVANFMRQDLFEFTPVGKLIFAGNHKPGLKSVDEAIRRRVHIVPFTVTIPIEERDPNLEDKLAEEHGGILQWMIQGCLKWQQIGLVQPECVKAATASYMETEDVLADWIDECLISEEGSIVHTRDLYANYVDFCEKAKERPWSSRRLTNNLLARGFDIERMTTGKFWKNIRLELS